METKLFIKSGIFWQTTKSVMGVQLKMDVDELVEEYALGLENQTYSPEILAEFSWRF